MVRVVEHFQASAAATPVFLEPSGRRWLWFRLIVFAALLIGTLSAASVIIRSYNDPTLPLLELPIQLRKYAIPPDQTPLAGSGASNLPKTQPADEIVPEGLGGLPLEEEHSSKPEVGRGAIPRMKIVESYLRNVSTPVSAVAWFLQSAGSQDTFFLNVRLATVENG